MKTRNLLLALGCAAAFTACTNNDEPAVAPAMRTVTMSVEVEEPASTRVVYEANSDETLFKFSWEENDWLRVFYKDSEGTETHTDFKIDAETINGKQASFTGELPTGVTKVTIVYSSDNYRNDNGIGFGSISDMDVNTATALGQITKLYAVNQTVTEDGKLPDVKLKHAAAYVLLKAGLQVADQIYGEGYGYYINSPFIQRLIFSSEGLEKKSDSGYQCLSTSLSEGKLTKDCVFSFYVPEGGATYSIPFCILDEGISVATVDQTSHAFMPGMIYEVKANNTTWVAVKKLSE